MSSSGPAAVSEKMPVCLIFLKYVLECFFKSIKYPILAMSK